MRKIAWIAVVAGVTGVTVDLAAWQPPDETRALRARYERALLDNPSRGTAFERLFQSYADEEGVEAWLKRLTGQAAENPQRAAFPLLIGFVHERLGDEPAALDAYDEAQRREPKNFRPPAARGRLLTHLRRFDAAARALEAAVALGPPRIETQDLYKSLGRIYARQGKLDEAKAAWLKLAELFPRDYVVIEELAELLADEGQLDAAIEQYERLRQRSDDDYLKVRTGQEIAELRLRQRKFDDATAILAELLDGLAPDSWLRAETRRRLEEAFQSKGDLDGLVRFYTEWLEKHADDVEVRLALAAVFRRKGHAAEATSAYEDVLRRAGSRRDARAALAELYVDQGRYRDAAGEFRKIAEAAPQEGEAWERLGDVLFDDLETPEAERRVAAADAWRHILSERPNDPTRAIRAAEVFRVHKLSDESLEHYEKAIALAPENTAYYEYAGEYLHQLGRKDDAIARWRELVRGKRATTRGWLRLTELLATFGYADECLAAVNDALATRPDGLEAFKLVGLRSDVLAEGEKYAEAAAAIDELQSLAESPAQRRDVMDRRVKLAQRAGRLDDEIARLTRELSSRGADSVADSFELLARLHRAASHATEAIAAMEKAIALDTRSPERLARVAEMHEQAGNMGQAVAALKRMIQLDPRQESLRLEEIAELSRRQGDFDSAVAAAERLIELTPDAERGYVLASDLQWQAGRSDAAIETLRRGIRREPRALALHTQLAWRLLDANQLGRSLDQFWRAFELADSESQKLQVAAELARVYFATGQFERLVERLSERRRNPAEELVATLALAAAYREANRLDRVEAELSRALAKRPTDTLILEQLIELSEGQQQTAQAIVYAERLAALRPTDARTQRRLASLLYQAGRVDDAIGRWRASLQFGGNDPASIALELTETLLEHDLDHEAHQTLLDAATRFPDDWRVAYRLSVRYESERQFDRARQMFDQLMQRRPPSVDLVGGSPLEHPSYLEGGGRPALVNQWSNLGTVTDAAARDFSSDSDYYSRGSMRAYMGYGHNQRAVRYEPPDFASLQQAALVHRLRVAELDGTLGEYLTTLADRAGYALKLHDADARPERAAPRAVDRAARMLLLRALLCVHVDDEAFAAARKFYDETPEDLDLLALLAVFAAASPADGAGQSLPGVPIDVAFALSIRRPGAFDRSGLDAESLVARLAKLQPAAALAVVLPYATQLISSDRKADAARWLEWTLDQKPPARVQLECLDLLLRAGHTETALARLGAVRTEVLREARANAGASATLAAKSTPGSGGVPPSARQRRRIATPAGDLAEPLIGLASALLEKKERRTAVELLIDYVELAMPQPGAPRGAAVGEIFQLGSAHPAEFPSSNKVVDAGLLDTLRNWQRRLADAGLPELLTERIAARLETVEGPARTNFTVALAVAHGLARRLDRAAETLGAAATTVNDDRLRLIVAQLLVQQHKTAAALDELKKVQAVAGPEFKEAQVAIVQTASRLGQLELARQAALQLFGLRLSESDATTLATQLRSLGLDEHTAQLQARSSTTARPARRSRAANTQQSGNRRVDLLRQFVGQHNNEAVASLVRRIVAERAKSMSPPRDDSELQAALAALEETGQLQQEVERLEAAREQMPDSTETLFPLYLYYTAAGQKEKLAAVTELLFAKLPNNATLRYQHAFSLMMAGQIDESLTHFDRVLREAPWVVDEGQYVAIIYLWLNQAERLSDLILAVRPTRRLSLTESAETIDWIREVAEAFQEEFPDLALGLYRHDRELRAARGDTLETTQLIVQLLCKMDRPDELLAELSRYLPAALKPGTTDARQLRERYKQLAASLFVPADPNQGYQQLRLDARRAQLPMWNIAHHAATHDRLAAIDALLATGSEDADWAELIGLAGRAFVGLERDPPELAPLKQFVRHHESLGDEPTEELEWRGAQLKALLDRLERGPSQLPLAARLAACRLKQVRAEPTAYHEKLELLDVEAQAALVAGDRDKARAFYTELVALEDPNLERAQHGSYDAWQALHYKRRYFDAMRKHGMAELARGVLVDCANQISDGNSWQVHPCEELLAEWCDDDGRRTLDERIAELERERPERPNDAVLVNRLVRFCRVTGRASQAESLLRQVATMPGVTDYQVEQAARALYALGCTDEARAILRRQLKNGSFGWLASGSGTSWFLAPDDAEQLARQFEALPREPRFLGRDAAWMSRVAAAIAQPQTDRAVDERRQLDEAALRIYRVADQFTAVNTRSSNRGPLGDVLRTLVRLGRNDDAFDYVRRSIFDAKGLGLPEPSFSVLFDETGFTLDGARRPLASELLRLADRTGRVAELRAEVESRQQKDPLWSDAALRLLGLVELEYGDAHRAAELLGEIASRPAPPTANGVDTSLLYLAKRAARRPELLPVAVKLQAKLVESIALSPRDDDVNFRLQQSGELARMHLKAGQTAAAVAEARRWLDRAKRKPDEAERLQLEAARLLGDAGHWSEALDVYRERLRAPDFDGARTDLDPVKSSRMDELDQLTVQALVRMRDAGQLDELAERLRREWDKSRPAPNGKTPAADGPAAASPQPAESAPGRHDCEPLALLAACYVVAGRYDAARQLMAEFAPNDMPASVRALPAAVAASPKPEDAVELLDEAFVRWPYLLQGVATKFALLHVKAARPLPIADPRFVEYVRQLAAPGTRRQIGNALAPGQRGLVSAARIAPEQQRNLTTNVLKSLKQTLDTAGQTDEFLEIGRLTWRNMRDDPGTRWLTLLARSSPNEAYEFCCERLELAAAELSGANEPQPWNMQQLFGDEPTIRRDREFDFDDEDDDESNDPRDTRPPILAVAVIDAARRADKLAEFVAACERVVDEAKQSAASSESAGRVEIAARLQLIALSVHDPDRLRQLVPAFLKGEGRFEHRSEADRRRNRMSAEFAAVADACWRSPPARDLAIEILSAAVAAERKQFESSRRAGQWQNPASSALQLRLAEMQFERGDHDAARRLCNELIREHVEWLKRNRGASDTNGLVEDFRLATDLLRRHATSDAMELVRLIRAETSSMPRVDRQLALVERELRLAAGEPVAPGVALAVEPAGTDRLRFVWQLNYAVPADVDKPEDRRFDASRDVLRQSEVPFVAPRDAASPDGYEVRLEASDDGREFQELAKFPAAERADARTGVSVVERPVKPGQIRWYRARLVRAGAVVATSTAVAGTAGENLIPSATFADRASTGELAAAWRLSEWTARPVSLIAELGPDGTESYVPILTGRLPARLEMRGEVAIDNSRVFILNAWTRSTPFPTRTSGSDSPRTPTGRASVIVSLRRPLDRSPTSLQAVLGGRSAFTFAQVVLLPSNVLSTSDDWHDVGPRGKVSPIDDAFASFGLSVMPGEQATLSRMTLTAAPATPGHDSRRAANDRP